MMLQDLSKALIFLGLLLAGAGILLWLAAKIPGVGRLPGDILIKKENFTFYFPLMTSLLLSLVVSLILYLTYKR